MIEGWEREEARRVKAALIDTTVANPARVADFLQGGRDNYRADRKAAEMLRRASAGAAALTSATRSFRQRAVRYLAAEAGLRQFLHVGVGLDSSGNTHEVTQSVDPSCRVVYADPDPMVLAHARALLRSAEAGAVGYVDADVRDPAAIMAGAAATLDLGRPVAVLLLGTLSFVDSAAEAADIVSALLDPLPPGSYVAVCHQASDLDPALPKTLRYWNKVSSRPVTLRSRAEIACLVTGLELVPPGLVLIRDWRPAPGDHRTGGVIPAYGLVARKP